MNITRGHHLERMPLQDFIYSRPEIAEYCGASQIELSVVQ